MPLLRALALVIGQCGCAKHHSVAVPGPPSSGDLAPPTYALVWHDAWFWFESASGPGRFRSHDWGQQARQDHPGEVWTVRVVGEDEERLEVALDLDFDRFEICEGDRPMDSAWALRFTVSRDDLAPVTTAPFTAGFEDGTRVDLLPGVAVVEGGVVVRDWILPVDLPDHVVGRTWQPPPSESGHQSVGRVPETLPLALGGKVVGVVEPPEWKTAASEIPFTHHRDASDATLLGFSTSCGELVLAADTAAFSAIPQDQPGGGVIGGLGMSQPQQLPASTPILWPDGSPAGVLIEPRWFHQSELRVRGELSCKPLPFGYHWVMVDGRRPVNEHLELCFAASALVP